MLEQYADTLWRPGGQLLACELVKIYPYDSNILASVYANNCGTQKLPNPMRTSDRGELRFWAEPGRYWLHIDGRTHPITVGEQQCISQQDLDQVMSGHVQSADPHGDRAAAQAALGHHSASTQNVHGILDTKNLATKTELMNASNDASAQAAALVEERVACHAAQTRNVHGICDTAALETVTGAQEKANQAVDAALLMAQQKVEEHAAKTTCVHGIADTSRLLTIDGARPVIEQVMRDSGCCDDSGGGTPEPGQFETPQGAQQKADAAQKAAEAHAHGELTRAVEELEKKIPDGGGDKPTPEPGGKWETPEGAQRKADAARDEAKKAAEDCCKATAEKAHDELAKAVEELRKEIPDGDGGGDKPDPTPEPGGKYETPEGAQKKADAAQKKAEDAAAKCCEATAKKAKDDLDKAVADLEKKIPDGGGDKPTPTPEPGDDKWETPAGARKKAEEAARKAVEEHIKCGHTLKTETKGVKVEKGWEVSDTELRVLDGDHSVKVFMKRTGDHLYSKDGKFESDGLPSRGNIVPDMLIAKLPEGWRPPSTFVVSAHTSYTSGSVRIHADGRVFLLDITWDNPVRKGHTLGFEFNFLEKSPCQGKDDGGEKPKPEEPKEEPKPAPGAIDPKALAEALKAYPSAYASSEDEKNLVVDDATAEEGEQLAVTLTVPPSRKVKVAMSMRASSSVKELAQSQQMIEVTKDGDALIPADKAPSLTLSHSRLNQTLTAARTFHIDFAKIGDGAAKAGDKVTFTIKNRATLGKIRVIDRDVAVESLMA